MKNADYRQPLYKRQSLRFQCTQCGACCTGSKDYHVYLDEAQANKIQLFLGIGARWFKYRYLATDENSLVLQSRDDGRCILLGKNGCCRVYSVRPVQCATYPFWPEVIKTSSAWRKEAKRCEGIDCGDAVSVEKIEAALKQCIEAENDD